MDTREANIRSGFRVHKSCPHTSSVTLVYAIQDFATPCTQIDVRAKPCLEVCKFITHIAYKSTKSLLLLICGGHSLSYFYLLTLFQNTDFFNVNIYSHIIYFKHNIYLFEVLAEEKITQ